jgi:hypothetical protein
MWIAPWATVHVLPDFDLRDSIDTTSFCSRLLSNSDLGSPLSTQLHKFLLQAPIHSSTAISSSQLIYEFLLQGLYTTNRFELLASANYATLCFCSELHHRLLVPQCYTIRTFVLLIVTLLARSCSSPSLNPRLPAPASSQTSNFSLLPQLEL